jgi:hypothetical protein
LLLNVSIKTYSFQDWDERKQVAGRYTKNIKRNDLELRDEADVVHRRQPYAVLVALLFQPTGAAQDGKVDKSSFAHAVLTLRRRSGRTSPGDIRVDLFERVYIGLYEYDGPSRGSVRFFDVMKNPPKVGIPALQNTLSFQELMDDIGALVRDRNWPEEEWSNEVDSESL